MLPEPDNRLKEYYGKEHSVNDNPILNRPLNPKLQMIVQKGQEKPMPNTNKEHIIYNIIKAILGIVNIVSFVGIFYYFIPGFNHVFTQGISWQPTPAFLCIIAFLISIGLTSNKKESK